MIAKIIDDKTIHIYDKSQFNWYQIRNSGQLFRDPPCEIIEETDKIVIKATGDKNSSWLWNFFDLDTDYNEIKKELMHFDVLHEVINAGSGIRILRQDFFEIIVSFICSAANKIPRIKAMVQRLCENYGNGDFPKIDVLLKLTKDEFDTMRFGKHGKNLIRALPQIAKLSDQKLKTLSNKELGFELTKIHAIGPKVRDCVMLFAAPFHRLDSAPVDTHVRRALEHLEKEQADAILNQKNAGMAQQYIFYYVQHLKKELK